MRTRNFVLRALGDVDRRAMEGEMRDVPLASGDVLYEPDYPVE